MKLFYYLLLIIFNLQIYHARIFNRCRFAKKFYNIHSSIFELDQNQTSLTIRPLYSLTNQSYSSTNQVLSIGIIYRFADTYLVPVPLLFECSDNGQFYSPNNCEFTVTDIRSDLSSRTTEPTRTATVPLHFQEYSTSNTLALHGAYFKQSIVALKNCRLNSNEPFHIPSTFYLHIEFEQTIGMKCYETCSPAQLYECSALTRTCQCRLRELPIERFGHLCVDTELASNCSLTPGRCRRLCHIQKQIQTGQIDHDCQCPLGTQRILANNIYHCELPKSIECDNDQLFGTCPKQHTCQDNRCVSTTVISRRLSESIVPLPFILIGLLIGAFLIIIILIAGLLKMRSIKCVKFVHPKSVLSNHSVNSSPATITRLSTVPSSASPCSTLSSSSKSTKISSATNKILENFTKIDLLE